MLKPHASIRQRVQSHESTLNNAPSGLRSQWHHVIDVAPTVLEACKLPQPRIVNGVPQRPIEGVSMLYSFNNAKAPDRHQIQYFEMFGNRGVYFDGWFAGTVHVTPWGQVENRFQDDKWELYHVKEDFSMADNLATQHPEVLEELKGVFLAEAAKYNVLPLDDRRQELFDPNQAGRPDLMFGRKTLTLYEGMGSLLENDFINIKNTSFEIAAEIEAAGSDTNGVIVQQGGQFGGWSLYVKRGKPAFAYNYLGLNTSIAMSESVLPSGKSTVTMDFAYDGGNTGAGGTATVSIDGKKVGSVRVDKTQPSVFSADETANVGIDKETPVSEDYTAQTSEFTGKIDKVTITVK